MTGIYVEVSSEEEFDYYVSHSMVCVVDFYTEQCGPCKKLAPELAKRVTENDKYNSVLFLQNHETKELPSKHQLSNKLVFLKVNAHKNADLCERFSLTGVPYLVFYKNGEQQTTTVLGYDPEKVMVTVDKCLV